MIMIITTKIWKVKEGATEGDQVCSALTLWHNLEILKLRIAGSVSGGVAWSTKHKTQSVTFLIFCDYNM